MSWENATSCNKKGKLMKLAMFPTFRSHLLLLQYTIGRSGKQAVYYTTTVNPKREGKYPVT